MDKDNEELLRIREILLECCKVNKIEAENLYAVSTGLMIRHLKTAGATREQVIHFFEDMKKAFNEKWDNL